MDGLIPLLVGAMKKQSHQKRYRHRSQEPSRSYHQMVGESADQVEVGSGYRRSRSEYHSPTLDEYSRRQPGFELQSRSVRGVDLLSSKLKEIGSIGKKSSKW